MSAHPSGVATSWPVALERAILLSADRQERYRVRRSRFADVWLYFPIPQEARRCKCVERGRRRAALHEQEARRGA